MHVAGPASAIAVAVRAHPQGSGNQMCAPVGYPRQVTTKLAVPLRARVLVSAVRRTAVPVTATAPAG